MNFAREISFISAKSRQRELCISRDANNAKRSSREIARGLKENLSLSNSLVVEEREGRRESHGQCTARCQPATHVVARIETSYLRVIAGY